MLFRDIPGHENEKRQLRELVDSGHLPHALLLEGPAGSAKYMLARAMAQYIHCTDRRDGDSCGQCRSCHQHQTFNHIDTVFSFPVIKRNSKPGISDDFISEFREFLGESPFMDPEKWMAKLKEPKQPLIYVAEANELMRRLNYTAHASRYKIVLMWLPERLKEEAANKLLKVVEEPFADTVFIMTSDEPRRIMPTVYSRLQRIHVAPYDDTQTVSYLVGLGVDPALAADCARLACGNINEAINIAADTAERAQRLDMFKQLMRLAYQRNVQALKLWAEKLADTGREPQLRFYDYCARLIRENFIYNLGDDNLNVMSGEEEAFAVNFARFINENNVLKIFDVFNNARQEIAANGYAKLINFDVAIKTILLLKQ